MNIHTYREPAAARCAVLSFSGWPDAGKLVEFTFAQLRRLIANELASVWDMDGFWHTDAVRPSIGIQHGQMQRLDWPCYQFYIASADQAEPGGPILLGSGPEPSICWRSFAAQLTGLLKKWECRQIFMLGSLFDQVFHDEVLISSVVHDAEGYNRARELGCQFVDYAGPSAIHSAIMAHAKEAGIRCMSLWAHMPFYLNSPHELLAAELVRMLGSLLGTELPVGDLVESWRKKEQQIEQIALQDHDLHQTLETMKRQKVMRRSSLSAKVVRLEDFLKKRDGSDPEQD